tara:strand:+ start:1586 stop:2491 length:906 start_codon:yes stop_codon:yes gene_type:complete
MTHTQLKAKPGDYVWNEDQVQFVGRINKDGTEDKRFSQGGLCSLLNTILEQTGYVPSEPQAFAKKIAEHRKSDYLVKGYGVVVKCYDLSAEMWASTAANYLGNEFNGIADILNCVSQSKDIEHKSKLETLALIFGKELKSKNLADYAGVTEFEKRLQDERKAKAKEETARKKSEKKLKKWIHDAFKNKVTLMKTWMFWEVPGFPGDIEWLVANVTLRWCLKNRAMKDAVMSRYDKEHDDLFNELNKTGFEDYSISTYAADYAAKYYSDEDFKCLTIMEDFYIGGIGTQAIYDAAKKEYLSR